jgi:hypothetical protein
MTFPTQPPPAPPATQPENIKKPDLAALEVTCKTMLDGLKVKYAKGNSPESLRKAAEGAFSVWLKAAKANTLTGAAQLDGGVPSIERYFQQRLPEKR